MPPDPPPRTREEIAHDEVGRTRITRAQSLVLAAAFLAVIGLLGPLQAVVDLRHPKRDQPFIATLFTGTPEIVQAFQHGPLSKSVHPAGRPDPAPPGFVQRLLYANARALEHIDQFETLQKDRQHSILTATLVTPVQVVMTGVLGAGNESAYPGRDGWAFFRDAVDHLTMPGFLEPRQLRRRGAGGAEWRAPPLPDPRPAILYFHDYLRGRGIELIVMPVPVKAALFPDKLSARYDGTRDWLENPDLAKLIQTLERAGVTVYDTGEALYLARLSNVESVFLKTDTHWGPEAVDLVARELATMIRNRGAIEGREAVAYRRGSREVTNLGDIAADLLQLRGTGVYEEETVTVQPVTGPDGSPWKADPDAEVLLLGDSFANIYSEPRMHWGAEAGLVEQLSFHLGRPVDRIVQNDAGAYATREELANQLRRVDRLAGKQVVIWEFAARELSRGDWRHIDWKRIDVGAALPAAATEPEGVPVEGRIAQVTLPPLPGTVTYRDCITEIHLTEILGDLPDDEVVVYVLGMEDNRWTAAAELRAGQRVRLRLFDWETAQHEAGRATMRHEPLDDPTNQIILLPVYWGELQK